MSNKGDQLEHLINLSKQIQNNFFPPNLSQKDLLSKQIREILD